LLFIIITHAKTLLLSFLFVYVCVGRCNSFDKVNVLLWFSALTDAYQPDSNGIYHSKMAADINEWHQIRSSPWFRNVTATIVIFTKVDQFQHIFQHYEKNKKTTTTNNNDDNNNNQEEEKKHPHKDGVEGGFASLIPYWPDINSRSRASRHPSLVEEAIGNLLAVNHTTISIRFLFCVTNKNSVLLGCL
jgi:hypothetical protein